MLKSLRWRLLAWHAGILCLAVAGFGAALYVQIRKARLDEVDAQLLASARTLDGALRGIPPHILDPEFEPPPRADGSPFDGPPPPPPRPGERDRPPPLREPQERRLDRLLSLPPPPPGPPGEPEDAPYFIVWLNNGEVFRASPLPPEAVPGAYDKALAADPGKVQVRRRGAYREVVVMGPRQSQVLVGRSVRREQHELTVLTWQLALTGLGVLVVGLGGGFFLSGRAVRPLAKMSATAAGISAANLHQRLDTRAVDSELGNLAAILNDMFGRLEGAFERQARFTADASHELRTPLTVIHSFAELALSKPRTAVEYQETLDTCVRAARRMKAIIEGLLTLARADAGKLELKREPLDLGELLTDAVSLLEPLAAQKRVRLTVQAPPLHMAGDVTRLAQVVTNLMTNAIHYNRFDGSVAVTLAADRGTAVLTVADTGCGIPEEDRLHLFERFYRVDKARSRELGGSGLGLAICKTIVEGLGGSITYTTAVGQGTTFVVRLPLTDSESET